MKITSNTIGNYGPGYLNQVRQSSQTASKPAATTVTTRASEINTKTNNIPQVQQSGSTKTEGITNDEKMFFMGLYPENQSEIVDYHFYQKSGKMSGVSVGTLFDRRG